MAEAVAEAQAGLAEGGIPVGAVLVHRRRVIGRGRNRRVQRGSAVLHGEMDALERAGRRPAAVYAGSALYTTLSPCPMCAGAVQPSGQQPEARRPGLLRTGRLTAAPCLTPTPAAVPNLGVIWAPASPCLTPILVVAPESTAEYRKTPKNTAKSC